MDILAAVREYNADDLDWVQPGQTRTLGQRIEEMRPVVQVRIPDHRSNQLVFVAMIGLADQDGFFVPAADEKSIRMTARTRGELERKARWWASKAFGWSGEVLIKR